MSKNRLGKSEARARFLPLVESVAAGGGPVEITDRGKIAAVLLSHADYLLLLAQAKTHPAPRRSPVGTAIVVEDLEKGASPGQLLRDAIDRSGHDL